MWRKPTSGIPREWEKRLGGTGGGPTMGTRRDEEEWLGELFEEATSLGIKDERRMVDIGMQR